MKVSYLGNLTSTFLLFTSFFCVQSAPARPLNERSTQFAWVLLEEQQNDSSPRRKITPKSIFISPSFSTQTCSTGYTLDASGRCIKVVKLDASAHEKFLLELLNQNFGNFGDYEDEDVGGELLPTPGPFQLNIPLLPQADADKISIVVAPTNGQFEDTLKIHDTSKFAPNNCNQSAVDAPFIIAKIDISDVARDQQAHKTTTRSSNAATNPTTTRFEELLEESGTMKPMTMTNIVDATTSSPKLATTTDAVLITTLQPNQELPAEEQQAIFFKISAGDASAASSDVSTTDVTTRTTTTRTPAPTNRIRFPERAPFDPTQFEDFLQGMKKQVNRRFVGKPQSALQSEELLYNNHRNRDRWLFPRLQEQTQGASTSNR